MWGGDFGANKSDNTPHKFIVGGSEIEVYFSPSDQTTSQINKVIESVNYSFEFGLLSFTRDDLAQSIILMYGLLTLFLSYTSLNILPLHHRGRDKSELIKSVPSVSLPTSDHKWLNDLYKSIFE